MQKLRSIVQQFNDARSINKYKERKERKIGKIAVNNLFSFENSRFMCISINADGSIQFINLSRFIRVNKNAKRFNKISFIFNLFKKNQKNLKKLG